ncbi:hypothetical protein [Burkholderia sp. RF2-non_BP3]|uniref:hypothetical protein n=1 Tax=Burkholderia sp. RF2-non_BP3 TaxID=1637844 RepID=UPI000A9245F5|nr:hypothetical protein [Burkholderia sp. RF2-non_BP3]
MGKIKISVILCVFLAISINGVASPIDSFSGEWDWVDAPDTMTFSIDLTQNGTKLYGQYCAVAQNGNKVDCDGKADANINGIVDIAGRSAIVNFSSFFGARNGKASLNISNGRLVWHIVKIPADGEFYAPKKAILVSHSSVKSNYLAENVAHCSVGNIKKNVFDASVLAKNSWVSIENGTAEYPIILDFYRPTKYGCKKTEFARYSVEGGAPTVESIFFMPLHGRVNVFSIVAWDISSRGDGTYGRLYQVYAYFFDEDGMLVENKHVSEDDSMTGIDGYSQGVESKFRYRTASDVKKYWRSRRE